MAIALLAVLVVGLLRSHAEILRRLHELGVGLEDPSSDHVPPVRRWSPPAEDGTSGRPAHDIVGHTPMGETAAVGVAGAPHPTLIAFLSSGCLTCAEFWRVFAATGSDGLALPSAVRPLIVTKSADAESVSAIAPLAPADVTVVMSTQAWLDYDVPGAPYFVLVDGPASAVVAEGTGTTWDEVRHLMGHLGEGERTAPPSRRVRHGAFDPDAPHVVDAELMAAGIGPGHPSLYPEDVDEG